MGPDLTVVSASLLMSPHTPKWLLDLAIVSAGLLEVSSPTHARWNLLPIDPLFASLLGRHCVLLVQYKYHMWIILHLWYKEPQMDHPPPVVQEPQMDHPPLVVMLGILEKYPNIT